jgi:hypothetical protein
MLTNLIMKGGKWAVEVRGAPDEEVHIETFSGREHATNQIRMWATGQSPLPVLKKKGAKMAPAKKTPAKKAAASKKK